MERGADFDTPKLSAGFSLPVTLWYDMESDCGVISDGDWVRPGYLFVEPRRHVATLDLLDDAETVAFARAVRSSIGALRRVLEPAHVFTFVAGLSAAGVHLHQHVFTRPASTARDVPWHNADSPDAPQIPASGLDALCAEPTAALPG
ncbi:HIT family protein [Nocardia sp. bgisy134]|uniref:HIT family protein n=1 Tax=unclassified Nocardia TaxID=2637762 RepID=UPI003D71A3C9